MGCIRGITENSPGVQPTKILLTGAAGQLGQVLRQKVPEGIELIATSRNGGDALLPLDLADAAVCRAALLEHRPDWVLNGGAYTAVDKAESEPELALTVNTGAPRALAEAVEQLLAASGQGVILRTNWVIGPVGKKFALTMLRLHRECGASGQALGVVEDQVGCRPSAPAIPCWIAPAAGGPSAWPPPPGARPCGSFWRRWAELNCDRTQPSPGC